MDPFSWKIIPARKNYGESVRQHDGMRYLPINQIFDLSLTPIPQPGIPFHRSFICPWALKMHYQGQPAQLVQYRQRIEREMGNDQVWPMLMSKFCKTAAHPKPTPQQ